MCLKLKKYFIHRYRIRFLCFRKAIRMLFLRFLVTLTFLKVHILLQFTWPIFEVSYLLRLRTRTQAVTDRSPALRLSRGTPTPTSGWRRPAPAPRSSTLRCWNSWIGRLRPRVIIWPSRRLIKASHLGRFNSFF